MTVRPLSLLLLVACGKSGIVPRDTDATTTTVIDADTDADSDSDTDADTDADTDTDTVPPTDTVTDTDVPPTDTVTDTDTPPTDTDTDVPPPLPWSHTPVIDGSLGEWTNDELFASSSGQVWLTWDATHLYVAVSHPDVAAGGSQHWILVYLGSPAAAGTQTGVLFGLQEPALPVPFSHLVRWKADDSYDGLMAYTGTWTETPYWLGTGGSAQVEDNAASTVEFAIPLTVFSATSTAYVHVSWLFEGAGFESSYGVSPIGSFAEGAFDPDYAQYWSLDLTSAAPPVQSAVVRP